MRGKLFGERYRVQQKIGEGGMAYVYIAHDEKLNRKVAIKVLHRHMADNPDIRQRFFQEAQAISSLDHPNILKIYDFSGERSEELWMVTEILNGVNLNEYVQSFPGRWLHPIVASLLVREIIKALEQAHDRGIIHRDIKPENIFVLNSGGIKLMDFGIAKNTRGNSITMTGTFMGSPSYMSPEQIRGKSIDQRSDIYSLGILFYEVTAGKLPYSGSSTHDVVMKICEGNFKNPRSINPGIPEDIERITMRAMAMFPSARYQDIRSFAKDLDRWLHSVGFEESHVELERYFKDREQFQRRLRQSTSQKIEVEATAINAASPSAPQPSLDRTRTRQRPASHPSQQKPRQQASPQPLKRRAAPTQPVVYRVVRQRQRKTSSLFSILSRILLICAFIFACLAVYNLFSRSPVTDRQPKNTSRPTPRPQTNLPQELRPKDARPSFDKKPIARPSGRAVIKTPATSTSLAQNNNKIPATEAVSPPSLTANPQSQKKTKPDATLNSTSLSDPQLKLTSRPAAEIFIDGQRFGTTIDQTSSSAWIKLKPGRYLVELRRDGYVSHKKVIQLKPGEKKSEAPVDLVPDSTFTVTLNSNAPSTRVQINNLSTGASRFIVLGSSQQTQSLPSGRYRISFEFADQVIERSLILEGSTQRRSLSVSFRIGETP